MPVVLGIVLVIFDFAAVSALPTTEVVVDAAGVLSLLPHPARIHVLAVKQTTMSEFRFIFPPGMNWLRTVYGSNLTSRRFIE